MDGYDNEESGRKAADGMGFLADRIAVADAGKRACALAIRRAISPTAASMKNNSAPRTPATVSRHPRSPGIDAVLTGTGATLLLLSLAILYCSRGGFTGEWRVDGFATWLTCARHAGFVVTILLAGVLAPWVFARVGGEWVVCRLRPAMSVARQA
ncbi:MAG: hypothetical protein U0872_11430 [Planctomycetaceae bacterium]